MRGDEDFSAEVSFPNKVKVNDEFVFISTVKCRGGIGLYYISLPTYPEMEISDGTNVHVMFKGFRNSEREFSFTVKATRRGLFELSDFEVSFVPMVGLLKAKKILIPVKKSIEVEPAVTMLKKSQFQFRNKLIKPRLSISRLGPPTNDFETIREYIPGDPYKSVNWKATARNPSQDKILVNIYEREGLRSFIFILDRSKNMLRGTSSENPLEYAIPVILSGSKYLTAKGSNVGFWQMREYSESKRNYILPSSGADTFIKLRRYLIRVEAPKRGMIKYHPDESLLKIIRETTPQVMLITSISKENYRDLASFSSYLVGFGARLTIMDILPEGIMARYRNSNVSSLFTRNYIKATKTELYNAFSSAGIVVQWDPSKESLGLGVSRLARMAGW